VLGAALRSKASLERQEAAAAFSSLLNDPSVAVRIAAAQAMFAWGDKDEATAALLAALQEKQGSSRLTAVTAIASLGQGAAHFRDALQQALKDPYGDVVKVARRTLKLLDEPL
jgi:HEAT repeat protein